jgi:hypothetical protein
VAVPRPAERPGRRPGQRTQTFRPANRFVLVRSTGTSLVPVVLGALALQYEPTGVAAGCCLLAAGCCLLGVWRWLRVGLTVTDTEFISRGPFRDRRFSRTEVLGALARPVWPYHGRLALPVALIFVLADGSHRRIPGVQDYAANIGVVRAGIDARAARSYPAQVATYVNGLVHPRSSA